jgi:hypothetical protein
MKQIATIFAQILGLGIAMGSTFSFHLLNCLCEYRRGLGLQKWSPVPLLYPIEWLLVPIIYVCILALCATISGVRRKILTTLIGACAAFIFGLGLFFSLGKPPARCYLEGFQKNVAGAIRIEEVKQWKQQLLRLTGDTDSMRELRKSEIPNFVSKIKQSYSPRVTITFDGLGNAKFAVLMWGGGFQAYGIIVNLNGQYSTQTTPFIFQEWDKDIYFFIVSVNRSASS